MMNVLKVAPLKILACLLNPVSVLLLSMSWSVMLRASEIVFSNMVMYPLIFSWVVIVCLLVAILNANGVSNARWKKSILKLVRLPMARRMKRFQRLRRLLPRNCILCKKILRLRRRRKNM